MEEVSGVEFEFVRPKEPSYNVIRFVRYMHEEVVKLKSTPEGRAKLAAMHEARMAREAAKRAAETEAKP